MNILHSPAHSSMQLQYAPRARLCQKFDDKHLVAIDEPGGNRNRSINIKAQHKTRRAAITQIYF